MFYEGSDSLIHNKSIKSFDIPLLYFDVYFLFVLYVKMLISTSQMQDNTALYGLHSDMRYHVSFAEAFIYFFMTHR